MSSEKFKLRFGRNMTLKLFYFPLSCLMHRTKFVDLKTCFQPQFLALSMSSNNQKIGQQFFRFYSEWLLFQFIHGRRKGGQGRAKPPLDFKIFSKKYCFLSFEREKSNFTTFCPPLERFRKNPLVAPLEQILPTPMNLLLDVCFVMYFWIKR